MKKYPLYKDSGVEWLGLIPEEWEYTRVKNIFRLIIEPAPNNNNLELLSVYTDIGVKPRKELEERGNKASTTDGYWKVKKGDLIVNKLLAWMGAIGVSDYDGVTSPAYDILRPTKEVNTRFYHYLFRNPNCISELKKHSRGIMEMRLRLYFDKFGDIMISKPSKTVQDKIVNFLDDKTAKIDRAITLKEKMIALLKERKQIIIQDLVTGKKVWDAAKKAWTEPFKVKDSGVEWIGKIPEGWEVKRLKYLGNIYSGISGKRGEDFSKENNGYMKPFVPFTNICNNLKIEIDQYQYVKISDGENQNRIKNNDLLFLMSSETLEDIAKNSIYLGDDIELYLNSFCKGFRLISNKAFPEYVNYLLNSKPYRNYFSLVGRGFTRINLKQEYINDVYTLLPPIQEQHAIVANIEAQSTKIDQTIVLKEQQITKLKELKASLIDGAVTGKIKVV